MRRLLGLAASAMGLCAATGAFAAPSVEIDNAVARVIVSPEARDDIKVDVIRPDPRFHFRVWTFAGRTYIDGGLWNRLRGCAAFGGQPVARVLGMSDIPFAEMPQIVVRTPLDARVSSGGEVWGQVGRSATLELANTGCATWTAADVRGRLKVSQTGSGATRTGAAGGATLSTTGSGAIATGAVTGPVAAMNLGSGDIDIAKVNGALNVRIAGSGKVRVAAGSVSTMQASIAGSGDVTLNGVAGSLNASVMGSGDVRVARVTGPVSQSVMGSGVIRIGS
jgi:hypothetical protein